MRSLPYNVKWLELLKPSSTEVVPFRVKRFNEVPLSFAPPSFDLSFTIDRLDRTRKFLKVQQARYSIGRGETGCSTGLMLRYTTHQVAGDADIEHPRDASHDVDVVGARLAMRHTVG